jgi:hypothetical protein
MILLWLITGNPTFYGENANYAKNQTQLVLLPSLPIGNVGYEGLFRSQKNPRNTLGVSVSLRSKGNLSRRSIRILEQRRPVNISQTEKTNPDTAQGYNDSKKSSSAFK